jgi:hypothetical protein
MSTGYLRRPPDKKKPRPSVQTARLPKGSTGERADGKHTRFAVAREKESGATIEYGRYSSRADADRICGLLRWAGAVAHVVPVDDGDVEHVESAR